MGTHIKYLFAFCGKGFAFRAHSLACSMKCVRCALAGKYVYRYSCERCNRISNYKSSFVNTIKFHFHCFVSAIFHHEFWDAACQRENNLCFLFVSCHRSRVLLLKESHVSCKGIRVCASVWSQCVITSSALVLFVVRRFAFLILSTNGIILAAGREHACRVHSVAIKICPGAALIGTNGYLSIYPHVFLRCCFVWLCSLFNIL